MSGVHTASESFAATRLGRRRDEAAAIENATRGMTSLLLLRQNQKCQGKGGKEEKVGENGRGRGTVRSGETNWTLGSIGEAQQRRHLTWSEQCLWR